MNPPNTNLQPGQSGNDVAQLQQFLLAQGLLTQADIATGPGIYGPKTTNAVKRWQQANGVDNTSGPGYWGPRSIAVASGQGGAQETEQDIDAQYMEAAVKNPKVASLINGGDTAESIFAALQSGNLSGITNSQGMPFSVEEQQKAMERGRDDTKLYYEALQNKETASVEANLAQKQANYQDYLLNSGQQFEDDKLKADKSAADSGVLFSGSRFQKERKMQNAYNQDQQSQFGATSRDIGNTAQDFQYKYGNKAAGGLKDFFKLGANTYNAGVAKGGVGSSGISSIYNPAQSNYQGTRNTERSTAVNQRAAGYLQNRGNKLLASGYNNKL